MASMVELNEEIAALQTEINKLKAANAMMQTQLAKPHDGCTSTKVFFDRLESHLKLNVEPIHESLRLQCDNCPQRLVDSRALCSPLYKDFFEFDIATALEELWNRSCQLNFATAHAVEDSITKMKADGFDSYEKFIESSETSF